MRSHYLFIISVVLSFFYPEILPAKEPDKNAFVSVRESRFVKNGEPYYYIGTNFWYGAVLGSTGAGGDRQRLCKELDLLCENGIDNLRILVGADGPQRPNKVAPSLQIEPGVYNDTILDGLDYLLVEMRKRDMSAVLYLTNSWEWSGGYGQYLEWVTGKKAPIPAIDGWDNFQQYVSDFIFNDSCKALVKEHATYIIGRTNRYSNTKYNEDPTIMSWQIGNEPRAFSQAGKPLFAKWIKELGAHIKSIAPHQLVSVGSEGLCGTEGDIDLWREVHQGDAVDYMTIHIWPYNWGWIKRDNMSKSLNQSIANSKEYIDKHQQIATALKKPIVLEEFGFPRDSMSFTPASSTSLRDRYLTSIFEIIAASAQSQENFSGCNIWAWGGLGRASGKSLFWQEGDDYLGDPAQEEQGLNSIFDCDSTLPIIQSYNLRLSPKAKKANQ